MPPHYQLRAGKHVDRQIFLRTIQLLSEGTLTTDLKNYTYIGLGGPFLEDFRLMFRAFQFKRMISLEMDESVFKRQEFNRTASHIELRNTSTTEFIEEAKLHDFDNVVVWLDYTSAKDQEQQLRDAENCLRKMESGDIFRITVNAERRGLLPKGGEPEKHADRIDARRNALRSRLGEYWPSAAAGDEHFRDDATISTVLRQAFAVAAARAGENRRHRFRELHATTYADSTRMLSITGLITSNPAPNLSLGFDSHELVNIGVPALSAIERFVLEKRIPVEPGAEASITKEFEFLGEKEISQLLRFSRYLPRYSTLD